MVDTGTVDLRPITILLGQNSSGKSTFLRTIALFKQSIGVRAREPFLWVGEHVDFGGITETLSSFATNDTVSASFEMMLPIDYYANHSGQYSRSVSLKLTPVLITIGERKTKNPVTGAFFEYSIHYENQKIDFSLTKEGSFCRFQINGKDYLSSIKDKYVATVWRGPIPNFARIAPSDIFDDSPKGNSFAAAIDNFIKARFHGRTSVERRRAFVGRLCRVPTSELMRFIQGPSTGDVKWRNTVSTWTEDNTDLRHVIDLITGFRFTEIISLIHDGTSSLFTDARYITPLRANAERYYRKQGLAVNELDPRGTNFALFLDNLSSTEKRDFSDWSKKFFGVSIVVSEQGGHLSLFLKSEDKQTQGVNIADTGFGFSQIFPILAQLWLVQQKRANRRVGRWPYPLLFAIEQPELHLHPRLQAALADAFVNAVKAAREAGLDLRLIIETHSEYLINRLGTLIGRNELANTDASVLIFDRESLAVPTTIRKATYSQEGFLQDWPYGFFDPDYSK